MSQTAVVTPNRTVELPEGIIQHFQPGDRFSVWIEEGVVHLQLVEPSTPWPVLGESPAAKLSLLNDAPLAQAERVNAPPRPQARRQLAYEPVSGGVKIPRDVKTVTETRLREYAANFADRFTRLDIRFHRHFCYIGAYVEPRVGRHWPPNWPESREEAIERLRNTPLPLCRLRYFGHDDEWGFANYNDQNEDYEVASFSDGYYLGTPEEALHLAVTYHLV